MRGGRGEGERSEEVRAERGTAWHLSWGALYSLGGSSSRKLLQLRPALPYGSPYNPWPTPAPPPNLQLGSHPEFPPNND